MVVVVACGRYLFWGTFWGESWKLSGSGRWALVLWNLMSLGRWAVEWIFTFDGSREMGYEVNLQISCNQEDGLWDESSNLMGCGVNLQISGDQENGLWGESLNLRAEGWVMGWIFIPPGTRRMGYGVNLQISCDQEDGLSGNSSNLQRPGGWVTGWILTSPSTREMGFWVSYRLHMFVHLKHGCCFLRVCLNRRNQLTGLRSWL